MEHGAHHLNVVGEAGEDEAGDDEDHDEEPQLRHALAQREHDALEAAGVSGGERSSRLSKD